jgi:hypothetical protein
MLRKVYSKKGLEDFYGAKGQQKTEFFEGAIPQIAGF